MLEFIMDGTLTWPITAVLSLLIGSFLNVVILRLPKMIELEWQAEIDAAVGKDAAEDEPRTFNLSFPRSSCGNCGHVITWYENVPVLSWFVLRGKCSACSACISVRYPLIESLTALLGGFIGWQYGFEPEGIGMLLLTWALIALTFIDIDHQLLPDRITMPLIWLGLLLNTQETFTSLSSAVWGAIAGYISLWSVYWGFKLLTGKEGMGYGDFKLLAAIGAFGGVAVLPLTILFSSVIGVALSLTMVAIGKHSVSTPLPFGPYLAIAGWVAMIWGGEINSWYLDLLMSRHL